MPRGHVLPVVGLAALLALSPAPEPRLTAEPAAQQSGCTCGTLFDAMIAAFGRLWSAFSNDLPVVVAAAQPDRAVAHVNRAIDLLFAPQPADQQCRDGFLSLLDAIHAVAPDAPAAGGWPAKLAEARRRVSRGSLVDPRAAALLNECYRELHGGAAFRMPASVRSFPEAVSYGRRQLELARDLLRRGRTEDAVALLVETAVLVVTPVQ